ncbi:MAG: phage holin family protein [Bifidobacteriaceae bacterium]|jgi:hypothetical protein|nr:phage holin family protein [Bifidobacteriaceae bacterium]
MANRPIGELAGAVQDDVSAIVGDISHLARAELGRDGAKIAVAVVAFLAAGAGVVLALILLSIVVAEILVAVGLIPWVAYLIDTGIVLITAGALALIGKTALSKVSGPTRTIHAIRGLTAAIVGSEPDHPPQADGGGTTLPEAAT